MIDDRIKQYYEDNKDDVYKVLRYAILNGAAAQPVQSSRADRSIYGKSVKRSKNRCCSSFWNPVTIVCHKGKNSSV